jgi:hypothetical protein
MSPVSTTTPLDNSLRLFEIHNFFLVPSCRLCTADQMSNDHQVWMVIALKVMAVIFSNTVHKTPALIRR